MNYKAVAGVLHIKEAALSDSLLKFKKQIFVQPES